MGPKAVELVASVIDQLEERLVSTGRPPTPTIKVVETLRFFVREGVQWRELRASARRACGSTLRRRLDGWSTTALLRQVHAILIRMVRAGPETLSWDVVVDSCSVRAKHGGELTGPNPTDRGKAGDQVSCRGLDRGYPAGRRSLRRQCPRHAAFPASSSSGFGRVRRHRQAVCGRWLRQCREPQPLPARRHPASHSRNRCAAWLRSGRGPLRGRARLRLVVGEQALGSASGSARPHHPGPADRRLRLHPRQPPQHILKTAS
jgi:hypothetical protein